MDVAAEKATELPRLGKPRMKLNEHASHTGHSRERQRKKKPSSALFLLCFPSQFGAKVKERTRTNWGTPTSVNFVEKPGTWYCAVPTERIHHA